MKLIHLADLHFGRQLHGLSLVTQGDQEYWCRGCLKVIDEEKPDAVLIAGDVYDRSQPGSEARRLCSDFLTALAARGIPVCMISGNHDSGENIAYLGDLVREKKLYVAGVLENPLQCVTLEDAFGPVHIWMLPYFFPALARSVYPTEDAPSSYTEACRMILEHQKMNPEERNVLIAHQLVLSGTDAPEMGGSETTVGGVGQIDYHVFDDFDYVALGHIHKEQVMGRPEVRYAGSPLCYHFGEAGKTDEGNFKKGVLVVELGEKGSAPTYRRVPVAPLHPLRNMEGTLESIAEEQKHSGRRGEYIHVRLTDEVLPEDTLPRLRALFDASGSQMLWLDRVPRSAAGEMQFQASADKSAEEYFLEYYQEQRPDMPISPFDQQLIHHLQELLETRGDEETTEALAERLVRYAGTLSGEVNA